MMRQVIVNCLFYFVDIASLTLCSWYPVSLMVGGKKFVQNSKILRVIKIVAWLGFAVLTVMLPTLGRNDLLTMVVLSIYYIIVGYFLYHNDKVGVFISVGIYVFYVCNADDFHYGGSETLASVAPRAFDLCIHYDITKSISINNCHIFISVVDSETVCVCTAEI